MALTIFFLGINYSRKIQLSMASVGKKYSRTAKHSALLLPPVSQRHPHRFPHQVLQLSPHQHGPAAEHDAAYSGRVQTSCGQAAEEEQGPFARQLAPRVCLYY